MKSPKGKRRGHDIFALTISSLIFAALVAVFIFSRINTQRTPELMLPDDPAHSPSSMPISDDIFNRVEDFKDITVDKSNVQSIVSTLSRPAVYTMRASAAVYYDGMSQTSEVTHYVRGTASRTDSDNGIEKFSVIVTPTNVYTFAGGTDEYVVAENNGLDGDDFSRMPSYETLVLLPRHCISSAYLDGKSIVVVTNDNALDYIRHWTISLDTGLLSDYSVWKNGEMIYSCTILSLSLDVPAESMFLLPTGVAAE